MSAPLSCVNSCAVRQKLTDRKDGWPLPLQINHTSRPYADKENQPPRDILMHQRRGFQYMTEDTVEKYAYRKRYSVSATPVVNLSPCSAQALGNMHGISCGKVASLLPPKEPKRLVCDKPQGQGHRSVAVSRDSRDRKQLSQIYYIVCVCCLCMICSRCNEDASLLYSNPRMRAVRLIPVENGDKDHL